MAKVGKCVICGQKFQAKNKGFKRFSLKAQLGQGHDVDVAAAISRALPLPDIRCFRPDGHVCDSCFRLLRSTLRQREQLLKTEIEWENRVRRGPCRKLLPKSRTRSSASVDVRHGRSERRIKRKLGEVQNIMADSEGKRKRMKLEPTVAVLCKNGGHKNYMKQAIGYLLKYRYHRAISTIIAGSQRAKRAFVGVMEDEIRKEVFYFCKAANKFSPDSAGAMIRSFSWKKECREMESKMPTFYSACYAAMDTKKGTDLMQLSSSSKSRLIRPRLGLMMLLPLYTRRERKFTFVMHTLSLLLRKYGNDPTMTKILSNLGICQRSTTAVTSKADSLQAEDWRMLLWWASKNLGEIETNVGKTPSRRKGRVPKAKRPPSDPSLSDNSLDSEDDIGSDEENSPAEDNEMEDDEDEDDEDDDDDDDDDDDSSLLNMLSSDDDDDDDDDNDDSLDGLDEYEVKKEEKVGDNHHDGEVEVTEEQVEVEGCLEDINGQSVEIHVLLPS